EAADHHHRRADRPGEPGEAAREADEEIGVAQPVRAFEKRPAAGLVLDAVRDVVPYEAVAVDRLLVDADDSVSRLLQKAGDLVPAERVVQHLLCVVLCTAMQT